MKTFKKPSKSIFAFGTFTIILFATFLTPVYGQWNASLSPVYLSTSTASVGIGTSSPTQRVDITGDSIQNLRINSSNNRAGLLLQSNGSGLVDIFSPSTSDDLRIAMSGTQRFTFTAGGRLGIGTTNTSPFGTLDIRGSGLQRIYLESTNNQADMHFKSNGFGGFIIGQNTASDFTFWENTSAANKMVIKTNGRVGIGNSAPVPTEQLHISNSGVVNLRVESTNSLGAGVLLSSGTSNSRVYSASQSDADIRFATTGSDRMQITSNGFVGINVLSPKEMLHVSKGSILQESNSYPSTDGNWNLIGIDSSLTLYNGHMANSSSSAVEMGLGTDVTSTSNVPSINWYSDLNPPRDMVFNYINTYGGSPTTEIMRLLNDGKVLIGATTPPGSTEILQVNGDVYANNIGGPSDVKFKKDIKQIDKALEKVSSLEGVQYQWRKEEFKTRNFPDGVSYGLIAQELEKVIPEIVNTNSDGYKSVNYLELIPFLVQSIKELKGEVESLQEQVEKASESRSSFIGNNGSGTVKNKNILKQNRPNPFSNNTIIEYTLSEGFNSAYIQIFEPTGKPIAKHQLYQVGSYSLEINRNSLSSGLYMYALVIDNQLVDQKSMIVE